MTKIHTDDQGNTICPNCLDKTSKEELEDNAVRGTGYCGCCSCARLDPDLYDQNTGKERHS